MHEIIHLSHSAQANHLTTHFYNAQNSYFAYSDADIGSRSFVDPSVHFRQGLGTDQKTKTFTPRTIIWDMRGGFGSLKKSNPLYNYEGQEEGDSEIDLWSTGSAKLTSSSANTNSTIKQEPVPQSEYQQALDSGKANALMLDPSNTKYWSDYVNIYYNPKQSFHTLPNWVYDPDTAPLGQVRGETGPKAQKFLSFSTGTNEFKEANALGYDLTYIEDTLRPFIEECDNLSGLTLASEVDTAWGGFSARVIEEFRQDYIPKTPLFVWGLYDEKLTADLYSFGRRNKNHGGDKATRQQALSRIQSTIALANSASLFIPLSIPRAIQTTEMTLFDAQSLWHRSAMLMLPFETISVLSSLRDGYGRVPMQHLLDSIQGGTNRNIVSNVTSSIVHEEEEVPPANAVAAADDRMNMYEKFGGLEIINKKNKLTHVDFDMTGSLFRGIDEPHITRYFSKTAAIRNIESTSRNTPAELDKSFHSLFDASSLQALGTPESALSQYNCTQPFSISTSVPSFPSAALNMNGAGAKQVYASLGMSTSTSLYMNNLLTTLKSITRSTDDGVDELKEDVAEIADAYRWEWSNSDDDFFDDE